MKKTLSILIAAAMVAPALADHHKEDGFTPLFDGKTLDGWKISTENPSTFSVEDGAIKAVGPRAHAFYAGNVHGGKFDDFELRLDVKTLKNSNGGVYIHTEYQESGWPSKGYEVQVNNTHKDWKKTGGLYAIRDNKEPFKDGEWMKYRIVVKDKAIKIWVNDKQLVDYTEDEGEERPKGMEGRWLIPGGGTIGLQGHDPGSTIFYKNIRIKPLKK